MRVLAISALAVLLAGCGKQYIAAATEDALVVISDVEETTRPEQRQALVHYSLARPPRDGDRARMQETERIAFDCGRNMSLSLADVTYPIKSRADEKPVTASWKPVQAGTYGADVLRIVCQPTAMDRPTIKPVRSIQRDWRAAIGKAGSPPA